MSLTSRGVFASKPVLSKTSASVPATSKRALTLCFAPLALLGVASAGAAITRQTSAGKHSVLVVPVSESALNRTAAGTRACGAANAFLQRVLGNRATGASATVLGDYSQRSTAGIGALSVLCDTGEDRYLMLINTKTRQVYAVNHVEETRLDMEPQQSGKGESDESAAMEEAASISRDAARGQALHYLSLIGVPSRDLTTLPNPGPTTLRHDKPSDERTYNFAFTDSRHPDQSIMVAVNGKDGRLQSLWRSARNI